MTGRQNCPVELVFGKDGCGGFAGGAAAVGFGVELDDEEVGAFPGLFVCESAAAAPFSFPLSLRLFSFAFPLSSDSGGG